MAIYVVPVRNQETGETIPGFWKPERTLVESHIIPFYSREEAEAIEAEADTWRLLETDEVIEATDEYIPYSPTNKVAWYPVKPVSVGKKLFWSHVGYFRRKR